MSGIVVWTREFKSSWRSMVAGIGSEVESRITENALHANYGSQDAFDEEDDLRLATKVANRNTQFSDDFSSRGHVYCFHSHGHDDDSETQSSPSSTSACVSIDLNEVEAERKNFVSNRKLNSCSDIEDILYDPMQIQNPLKSGILPWIEKLY
ncbi:hypothetical protein N7501_003390 [Penicillium viridicatum]|nr:hypothetical protein N7501_003390 [Penicillium viridicatum]